MKQKIQEMEEKTNQKLQERIQIVQGSKAELQTTKKP